MYTIDKNIFIQKLGTNNKSFLEKIKLNRMYSTYKSLKESFAKIIGRDFEEEEICDFYIQLQRLLGDKSLKSLVKNKEVNDLSILLEQAQKIYNMDIINSGEITHNYLEHIMYDKCSIDFMPDELYFHNEINIPISIDKQRLLNVEKKNLELIFEKYAEQIYYMYAGTVNVEHTFQDPDDYENAILNKNNDKYSVARIIGMSMISKLLKIYSDNELLNEDNDIKREIDIGLFEKLHRAYEKRGLDSRSRKLLENKEQYRNLATIWEAQDFECYGDLDNYHKYLSSMMNSKSLSEEKQEQIKEYLKKIEQIKSLDLSEVVKQKEEIKEFFDDFILEYELLIREDLLENVFEASQDKVKNQTIECLGERESKQQLEFKGILIDSSEQIDSMLLHFFKQPEGIQLNALINKYKAKVIQEIISQRGLRDNAIIPEDDQQLVSALRHFEEVLVDRTVVDGIAKFQNTEHMEHICTQTISKDKIKNIPYNRYAMLFDKNGVSVEDIIVSSSINLESNEGINNAVRNKKRGNTFDSELPYTSVPHNELVDFELSSPNNEIDLSRGAIKPSALCYFANVPMDSLQKKAFIKLNKLAEKRGIPIILVNLTALNKEYEQNQTKEKTER